jgi:preprotein translocase subunit YajC
MRKFLTLAAASLTLGLSACAPAAPAAAGDPNAQASSMPMLISMAVVFGAFYFLMIRPQKKREKQVQEMRSKIEVGDEIVTVGGIVGIVVSVKDDTLVIETGSDRSKIRIQKWAVQSNQTVHDTVAPEKK